MSQNDLVVLVFGFIAVVFVGSFISRQLKNGGCMPIVAALLTIGLIALGAMQFAK